MISSVAFSVSHFITHLDLISPETHLVDVVVVYVVF